MKIPPPPQVKVDKPLFPAQRQRQEEQDLGKELRQLCTDLYRSTHTSGWQEMFLKFRDAVNPGGSCDVTRLPFVSVGPAGTKAGAPLNALYSMLSWTIQVYWHQVVKGEDHAEEIRSFMLALRRLIGYNIHMETTLQQCKLAGDERIGYWIEVPK